MSKANGTTARTWTRILSWSGTASAVAAAVVFGVASLVGGWTGLGLVVLGGLLLLVAGLLVAGGLFLMVRRNVRLGSPERVTFLTAAWIVGAALVVVPFVADSAALVYRITLPLVGLADMILALLAVNRRPARSRRGGARPQRA